jgi:ABC-2 type transport system ATP-binding protein
MDEATTTESRQPVLVEVRGLKRHFEKVRAVDGVNFAFRGGEVHGFIGPNGAGKTTAMRIIATIDQPDDGDVLVDGTSAIEYPDRLRPRLGFMPDYLESYQHMTVAEYMDFYARAYRLKPDVRRRRLAAVIDFTGVAEMTERPVNALSKGQKQRLGLARVLINNPDVLILDEPASGLDPRARIEVRRLIRELADRGKAVFVSSHILSELSEICDSVTIIDRGKIKASDQVSSLQKSIDAGVRVAVHLAGSDAEERARLVRLLAEIPGVARAAESAGGASFSYQGENAVRADILARLMSAGFRITDFHADRSDLEDAFMTLTAEEEGRDG